MKKKLHYLIVIFLFITTLVSLQGLFARENIVVKAQSCSAVFISYTYEIVYHLGGGYEGGEWVTYGTGREGGPSPESYTLPPGSSIIRTKIIGADVLCEPDNESSSSPDSSSSSSCSDNSSSSKNKPTLVDDKIETYLLDNEGGKTLTATVNGQDVSVTESINLNPLENDTYAVNINSVNPDTSTTEGKEGFSATQDGSQIVVTPPNQFPNAFPNKQDEINIEYEVEYDESEESGNNCSSSSADSNSSQS